MEEETIKKLLYFALAIFVFLLIMGIIYVYGFRQIGVMIG